MSINTDTILIFDENHKNYQLLSWHYCQNSTEQLIILIKENDNGWLGSLISIFDENKILIWKNHLNHRQYQLYLSEQEDSIITHFEILQDHSLILYTSLSSLIITNNSFFISFQ